MCGRSTPEWGTSSWLLVPSWRVVATSRLGWRQFWLPFAGGLIWTAGSFAAFRSASIIGLARAAGTWTPLNIIVSFVWGALLFGELNRLSATQFAVLGASLVVVLVGVLLIVGSQDRTEGSPEPERAGSFGRGIIWATAAGFLWGTYFVPAQWARVPSQVSDFPLALGILVAGVALVLHGGESIKLPPKVTAVQLTAGVLFGIGNLALLSLVTRVGTGVGFTIAQLSLLVNAASACGSSRFPSPARPRREEFLWVFSWLARGVSSSASWGRKWIASKPRRRAPPG